MKFYTAFLVFLYSYSSFTCDERIERFKEDCQFQDRSLQIKNNFKELGIDYKKISGPRSLRFIDTKSWNLFIQKGGTDPSKIYSPAPETWQSWNQGAEAATLKNLNLFHEDLTLEFIQNLHKISMADKNFYSLGAYYLKGARPGKIRTDWFIRPPEFWFKCEDNQGEEVRNLLKDYDLKDTDGEGLISAKFSLCSDKKSYKGHVKYLASHKVKKEIRLWVEEYNKWVHEYLNGVTEVSPTDAAADLQRWYVSIHPFGDGNGRTSRYLQDLLLELTGIVPPISSDLSNDVFTPSKKYRKQFKEALRKSLDMLEQCLVQHQNKNVKSECQVLP